jgi:lycopene cyclase domain-containing protein
MTYLWLSVVFLAVVVLVLAAAVAAAGGRRGALIARWWMPITAAGVAVLILTAVFDNLMISSGLMEYAAATLSGVFIGVAPLEDFAYPVSGLILLPSLWFLFGRRRSHDR